MEDAITPRDLAEQILTLALDKKAVDPAMLEVGDLVGYTDIFVIVSARNPRQVRSIADAVRQGIKAEHGVMPVGVEGQETGRWVLVDFDDVVLHVFHEGTRAFYNLEGLWGDAPRLPVPQVEDGGFLDDDDETEEVPLFTLPS